MNTKNTSWLASERSSSGVACFQLFTSLKRIDKTTMPVRINASRMQARSGAVRPANSRFDAVQVSRTRCVREVACEAKKSVGDLGKADLEVHPL